MGGGISFRKHNDEDNTSYVPSHNTVASPSVNHIVLLPIESPCRKPHIAPINLNIVISPRREFALLSSIPFTPVGKDASIFCYYCPLCMEFFESVLRTKCCANYICLKCSIEYLNAKGLALESVQEIVGSSLLKNIVCPHCFTVGFNPQLVEREDSIRDYSRGVTRGIPAPLDGCSSAPGNAVTPLKVGDTFEDLKRKMIPFAVMRPDRQLLHGTAALETSIGRITPAERQASLSCIFDSVAEVALTISSPEQIAPPRRDSSKTVTDSTPEASTRSNKSNYSLKESLRSIRSTPSKIFIQADFENDATIASDREDLPTAFLPKNILLETCCHVVANQMMRKIIDDFKVDRNV